MCSAGVMQIEIGTLDLFSFRHFVCAFRISGLALLAHGLI